MVAPVASAMVVAQRQAEMDSFEPSTGTRICFSSLCFIIISPILR